MLMEELTMNYFTIHLFIPNHYANIIVIIIFHLINFILIINQISINHYFLN